MEGGRHAALRWGWGPQRALKQRDRLLGHRSCSATSEHCRLCVLRQQRWSPAGAGACAGCATHSACHSRSVTSQVRANERQPPAACSGRRTPGAFPRAPLALRACCRPPTDHSAAAHAPDRPADGPAFAAAAAAAARRCACYCWAKSVLACPCLQPAAPWCPSPADMAGRAQPAPRQRLRHGPRLAAAALCLLALSSGVAGVQYINDELLWMKAHWEDYKLAFPWSVAMKQRDMESTRQLQVGAAPVGAVAGSSCACLHICAVLMA